MVILFFSTSRSQNKYHLFLEVLNDPTPCPLVTIYSKQCLFPSLCFPLNNKLQEIRDVCHIRCCHPVFTMQPGTWLIFKYWMRWILTLSGFSSCCNHPESCLLASFYFFKASAVSCLFSLLLINTFFFVGFCALSWTSILQCWIMGVHLINLFKCICEPFKWKAICSTLEGIEP